MPKTYQRKSDGRFVATVALGRDKDGKRVRRVFYGDTKRDAERNRDDQIAREGGRLRGKPSSETIGDWMKTWLDEVDSALAPTTAARYHGVWKRAKPYLSHKRLGRLTTDDVSELYRRLLEDGVKPPTLTKIRTVLHRAIEAARERRIYLDLNPFGLVPPPRHDAKEQKWLTIAQGQRLIEACANSNDRLEAVVVIALTTGMRLGEILGLKWDDINRRGQFLTLRRNLQEVGGRFSISAGKTATARRKVGLRSLALAALKRRQRIAESKEWVFTTTEGTHPNRTSFRKRHYLPLLKTAKVPVVRFHDLRHTFASLLLQRGVPTKVVAEALGHSSPAITQRTYQHIIGEMQDQAIEEIDRTLQAPKRTSKRVANV